MNVKEQKEEKKLEQYIGKVPVDGLLAQLRGTENVVTQSVLVDCIIDRLKRHEYE